MPAMLIWRGFLFEMLGRFIRPMRLKQHAIFGGCALLFGLAHKRVRRCLPGGGHNPASDDDACDVDVTAVFIIFWNLESRIGHLVFR